MLYKHAGKPSATKVDLHQALRSSNCHATAAWRQQYGDKTDAVDAIAAVALKGPDC